MGLKRDPVLREGVDNSIVTDSPFLIKANYTFVYVIFFWCYSNLACVGKVYMNYSGVQV